MLCDIFIDERKYRYTLIDHQDVVNQRILLEQNERPHRWY
jgi:predicted GNAT family N-acyltransferase